jgi:ABC-type Mn2+/Zn2+ transport system ATPase subunit
MATIPVVGKCFADPNDFLSYLEDITFNLWRPRFVTVHHTGAPDLKTWNGWQTRPKPVTDEQWMKNLGVYYATAVPGVKSAWSAGPHFFVTPKHICVLSPPDKRGVHAASFNAVSWGVEAVGNFDSEAFEGPVVENLVAALAIMHIAAGLQPDPFQKGVRGLHFHRDDPLTKKTCPGKKVQKSVLVEAVEKKIAQMTAGDDPSDAVETVKVKEKKRQFVYHMQGLTKTYPGNRKVLDNIHLSFYPDAKIGVLGVNGSGKSTLLRIMAGIDKEYTGEAWVAEGARVGYLPQEPQLDPSAQDVRENVMLGVAAKKAISTATTRLAMNYSDETADEMTQLQDEIEAKGLWDLDSQVDQAMDALRCPPDDAEVDKLSGGERRRVALCKLLLDQPELLLLDEPTNHLDAETVPGWKAICATIPARS